MGISSKLYTFLNLIYRLAIINLLWLCFTVIGLILFGFFPATVAMFTVIRKEVLKEDMPIFQTFWSTYKQEFLKSNLLGLILVVIGYILYIDIVFLKYISGAIQILYIPVLIMCIVYILMLLYIFPVYVHYHVTIAQVIKNAFLMMVLYPIITFLMIIFGLVVSYIMFKIPSSIIFFSGSIISYIIMWCANIAFQKNTEKLEKKAESLSTDHQ